ncbi:MAG TPA: serine hydrolase domain-containing protein, partial [Opitutus sp.]|nr:serine hydrolase domain-containing protein [Opitutus sp.]
MLVVGVFSSIAFASLRVSAGEALRFDPERLGRLDRVIEEHVARRDLAGAVMFIARDGKPVKLTAYGLQDIEADKPMAEDAIFRIASMSKAVTTVAALMLYEEGKFLLREPLSKYLPAFENSMVAVPAPEGSPAGTKFVLEKAKRPIWIRDLMTHTAGLTYGGGGDLAAELYREANVQGWNF